MNGNVDGPERVRALIGADPRIEEKKMFGGVVFLLHGYMLVGIWQTSLIVRLGPDQAAIALQQPHVGPFDVKGRPMKGWIMVDPDGLETDSQLSAWLDQASTFVSTFPPK